MTELTIASLPTVSVPAGPAATTVHRARTGSENCPGPGTGRSVPGWPRELIQRHRRRLATARAALSSLHERGASDRSLAELGPIGAAAPWLR